VFFQKPSTATITGNGYRLKKPKNQSINSPALQVTLNWVQVLLAGACYRADSKGTKGGQEKIFLQKMELFKHWISFWR
jgi:hypothetical protein